MFRRSPFFVSRSITVGKGAQAMGLSEFDETPATSNEVVSRVFEQFAQIASACHCLCSLGYGHGWPIRLGGNTSSPSDQTDNDATPESHLVSSRVVDSRNE